MGRVAPSSHRRGFNTAVRILTVDVTDPAKLAALVTEFFRHVGPEIEDFEHAADEFKERVPDLAEGLAKKIEQSHNDNPAGTHPLPDLRPAGDLNRALPLMTGAGMLCRRFPF
jgi:hypothetical protein